MRQTTKRYKALNNHIETNLKISDSDSYQFGCKFEFYIDTTKRDLENTIKKLKDKIAKFTDSYILVDLTALPTDKDKNECVQIKPDQSLDNNGVEISIPITTKDGVGHYIKNILPLIEEYGSTNKDTGLHFHISTIEKNGVNFDFYVYMLMCDDKRLLSSWAPRNGYSQNVMDILSKNTQAKTKRIKSKKGTVWNLEKISSNHIEIKTIGGDDYHKEVDRIIGEFEEYAECFDVVARRADSKYRESLIKNHKQLIKSVDIGIREEFAQAVNEAGLMQ